MLAFFLFLHNLTRWVVIGTAIWALISAWRGWLGKRTWTETDRKAGVFFGIAMDTQLLIGLILYFGLSPKGAAAFAQGMATVMGDNILRFYAVEHIFMMVLAVVFVHLGSVFAKKAAEDTRKFRAAAIWYSLSVLLVLVSIPWQYSPLYRLPF